MPKYENKGINKTTTVTTTKYDKATRSRVTSTSSITSSSGESTSKRSYNERYPFVSFLNVPTFIVLFAMIILGSTALYYNKNIDTYMPTTEINSDGTEKMQPYRVDYLNDQPIAELNGHTLKEVFEDGNLKSNNDFKDGTTGWLVYGDGVVNNEVFEWTATTNFQNGLIGYLNISFNKNYYIANYVKTDINYNYTQRLFHVATSTTLFTFDFLGSGNYEIDSFIFNSQIDGQIEYRPLRNQTYDSDFKTIYLEEVVFIELDVLGISPTTDMDYYYSLYQAQEGVQFKNYYYLSTEDYSNLGETTLVGYKALFNEGGLVDSGLNLVSTVQDVLVRSVETLGKAYKFFSISILGFENNDEFNFDGQLDRFGMEYEDIPKTKLEVIYRSLPKWMQPDTWFD